jgi:hypothetical protein
MTPRPAYVVGVGMTKFDKPGTKDGDYHDWAQLRGEADGRQVEDVTAGLQHNIGLGGTAVITAYQRAER